MRTSLVWLGLVATIIAASAAVAPADGGRNPRVTNRCPTDALPLRRGDLPALRRFALSVAPKGVERAGARVIDYRGARASVRRAPTFYTGYVRAKCPAAAVARVVARTADVTVSYPRVDWSASLSYSVFLVARTPRGLVAWAQMH